MKEEMTISIDELVQDDNNFNKGTEEGQKLMEKSFKELGAGRSILVDKDGKIIAGNKSQIAAQAAGIKKVRVIESDGTELIAVKRIDLSIDSAEGRKLALADNMTAHVNLAWDEIQIEKIETSVEGFDKSDWGFDVKNIQADPILHEEKKLAEDVKKRSAWGKRDKYTEPLCDLKDRMTVHNRDGRFFISTYKRSEEGIPLSEIKIADNVKLFALQAINIIRGIIGLKQKDGWCIITTPKRRHKEKNFASMVCDEVSKSLGVPFYEDVVEAKNKQRINPVFELKKQIDENEIIIYDDIFTTGSTLKATADLFHDKNVLCIIGIYNAS